jgi:membrane protein implicated in regulation of membrane protease activity
LARSRALRVLAKYALFQVPGWIAVSTLAWAAHRWLDLDGRLAILACAAWVAKDAVLYAFVRDAYAVDVRAPAEALVGARGVATEAIAPEGYVRIGHELWRARLAPGEAPIASGAPVVIESLEGLTLRVRVLEGT